MQSLKNVVRRNAALAAALAAMAASGSAMATGIDYTPITTGVDFTAVGTAVITVLGSVALVYVAFKGGKLLLSAIR